MAVKTALNGFVPFGNDCDALEEIKAALVSLQTNLNAGINSSDINANQITATHLNSTGVTPGVYTNPIVTFDADGRATAASNGTIGAVDRIILRDLKIDGVSAASFLTGTSWKTHELNSEAHDDLGSVSISSNQFTLQQGVYGMMAWAKIYVENAIGTTGNGGNSIQHQLRLYNVTAAAEVIAGEVAYAVPRYTTSKAWLFHRITVPASPQTYRLEHRHDSSNNQSWGRRHDFGGGTHNVYAEIILTKLT